MFIVTNEKLDLLLLVIYLLLTISSTYIPYSHQISPPLNFRPSGGRKLKGAN